MIRNNQRFSPFYNGLFIFFPITVIPIAIHISILYQNKFQIIITCGFRTAAKLPVIKKAHLTVHGNHRNHTISAFPAFRRIISIHLICFLRVIQFINTALKTLPNRSRLFLSIQRFFIKLAVMNPGISLLFTRTIVQIISCDTKAVDCFSLSFK